MPRPGACEKHISTISAHKTLTHSRAIIAALEALRHPET
jgi:hypothetical protein